VNYATGRSLTSTGSYALGAPTGLAVNPNTGVVYVSADTGPSLGFGIVRFDAATGNSIGAATGFAAGEPSALAINPATGTVFAAIDGSGTIQALAPNPNSADPNVAHPILSSATSGDFISLSADPATNRLFALKANELDVFSMTTGTLLGTSDYDFGGEATAISATNGYQGVSLSSQGIPHLPSFFVTALPVCNPQAAPTVAPGAAVTFTPDCTDTDGSTVHEVSVTNSQTLGSVAVSPDGAKFTYAANQAAPNGQDDIAFRVQTQDGPSLVKHQLVNVAAAPAPPDEQPVVRQSTNLTLDSGDVYIKVPGSDQFVKLTADTLVPVGTIIDATNGKAHVTMANQDGTTYDGVFWDGIFQVLQGSGANPITTMKLRDDLVGKASTARASYALASADVAGSFKAWTARKRGKKKNGLWGDGHGKFRTSGKGGSAAVRGTKWYVADYQYGSLFKVSRGVVTVDPIRGKNFPLKAGKQFFIFFKRGK
jgi:hypothetical protein